MPNRDVLMKIEAEILVCSAWDHRGKCMRTAIRWFHNPGPEQPFHSVQSACEECAPNVERYFGDKWTEISKNEVEVLLVMAS